MKIQHKKFGSVDGVERDKSGVSCSIVSAWVKNGATYLYCDGWREVQESRWVDLTIELGENLSGMQWMLPPGYRFRKVMRYDIPPGAMVLYDTPLDKPLKEFLKPCLILEKQEPVVENQFEGTD